MMCKQEGDLPSLFIPVVCLALLWYAATLLRSWGRGKEPGTSAPWEASWFRIRGVFLPLSCSGWCQPSRCPLDGMRGAKGTQPRAGELLVSGESFQAHLALVWHLEQATLTRDGDRLWWALAPVMALPLSLGPSSAHSKSHPV